MIDLQKLIDSGKPVDLDPGLYAFTEPLTISHDSADFRCRAGTILQGPGIILSGKQLHVELDQVVSTGDFALVYRDLQFSEVWANVLGGGSIATVYFDGPSATDPYSGSNDFHLGTVQAGLSRYGLWLNSSFDHRLENDHFWARAMFSATEEMVRTGPGSRWCRFDVEADAQAITPCLYHFFDGNNCLRCPSFGTYPGGIDFCFEPGTTGNVVETTQGNLRSDPIVVDYGQNRVNWWRS